MPWLSEFFYAVFLGLFSQNLALEMGIGTGRLFKLSAERGNSRRRSFFLIMLMTTVVAVVLTYVMDVYGISQIFTDTSMRDVTRGFTFVVVIAAIELVLELILGRFAPTYRNSLGEYLPAACLNSGVLAILLLNRQWEYELLQSLLFAVTAVVGYIVTVLIMQALRERVVLVRCPPSMKGEPLALLAAAILSLAFAGLTDMNFPY